MNMKVGNKIILRSLEDKDAIHIESLAGNYDISKTTLSIPHPYPEGAAVTFIKCMREAEKKGEVLIYAIADPMENELVGIINLNLSLHHKRGELAYWVGKEHWGNGYASEAARELLTIGFEEKGLNRIFAAAFVDNPGSWMVMEKIGMKQEGTLRGHVYKGGESVDLHYYGILAEDYFRLKA